MGRQGLGRVRQGWRIAAVLVAVLAASIAWPGVGQVAQADPLTPPPTTGTATGSYRTGLAKAGLVKVTSLADAHLWVGLKNKSDSSTNFDIRVELLNNGAPVVGASGLVRCASFAKDLSPREVVVPWAAFVPPTVHVGDVLALRVSTRIGTNPNNSKCGGSSHADGLRVSYDATSRASRFGATITPNPAVPLYLHSDGTGCTGTALTLSEAAPTATTAEVQGLCGGGLRRREPLCQLRHLEPPGAV